MAARSLGDAFKFIGAVKDEWQLYRSAFLGSSVVL
jgi:hypothetical protein